MCSYLNDRLISESLLQDSFLNNLYAHNISLDNCLYNASGTCYTLEDLNTTSSVGNASWNQSFANTLYAPNTTFGIQILNNNSNSN